VGGYLHGPSLGSLGRFVVALELKGAVDVGGLLEGTASAKKARNKEKYVRERIQRRISMLPKPCAHPYPMLVAISWLSDERVQRAILKNALRTETTAPQTSFSYSKASPMQASI